MVNKRLLVACMSTVWIVLLGGFVLEGAGLTENSTLIGGRTIKDGAFTHGGTMIRIIIPVDHFLLYDFCYFPGRLVEPQFLCSWPD